MTVGIGVRMVMARLGVSNSVRAGVFTEHPYLRVGTARAAELTGVLAILGWNIWVSDDDNDARPRCDLFLVMSSNNR